MHYKLDVAVAVGKAATRAAIRMPELVMYKVSFFSVSSSPKAGQVHYISCQLRTSWFEEETLQGTPAIAYGPSYRRVSQH